MSFVKDDLRGDVSDADCVGIPGRMAYPLHLVFLPN